MGASEIEAIVAAMLLTAITSNDGCGIDGYINGSEQRNGETLVSGRLNIDPSETNCAKIEADIADKKADTQYQKIVNFERVIRICDKQNLPELCARIPDMASRLDIE